MEHLPYDGFFKAAPEDGGLGICFLLSSRLRSCVRPCLTIGRVSSISSPRAVPPRRHWQGGWFRYPTGCIFSFPVLEYHRIFDWL